MSRKAFAPGDDAPDFGGGLPPEPASEPDDIAVQLASLGEALTRVAGQKSERQQVIRQIEGLLAKLTPKDYPELANSAAVQGFLEIIEQQHAASDDAPGTIYNRGSMAQVKKPWTWADFAPDRQEWTTFTPTESTTVTIQGVRATFVADVDWSGPRAFYDVYMESRRARRVAGEHIRYLFGQGGTPSDPTVVNDASMLVRAMATGGRFYPGAGVFDPGKAADEEPAAEKASA